MSARAFREHGIVFQSEDQVKRYDGLSSRRSTVTDIFSGIILLKKLSSLNWGNKKKIIRREKEIKLKARTKPVTRRCNYDLERNDLRNVLSRCR